MVGASRFPKFPRSRILIVKNHSALLLRVVSCVRCAAENRIVMTVARGMGLLVTQTKRRRLMASFSCF
jgi:hypothetical protein